MYNYYFIHCFCQTRINTGFIHQCIKLFGILGCYSNSIKKLVSENQNSKVGIRVHDLSLIPMFKKMLNENQISNNEYKKFEAMCSCHQQYNINIAPNGDVYQCDFALTPVGNITLNTLNNIIDRCYISHCSCN